MNWKSLFYIGAAGLTLFEIANVYYPRHGNLPDEQPELVAAFFGTDQPWKDAKGLVERLMQECGIVGVTWKRQTEDEFWHPGWTSQVFRGEHLIATINRGVRFTGARSGLVFQHSI